MQNKKLIVKRNWRYVVIISILFLVTIVVQDVTREIVIFNNDIVNLKDTLEKQMKSDVQKEVDYRTAEIENIIFDLKEDLVIHVEDNLTDLIFATNQIVDISDGETDVVIYDRIETAVSDYNSINDHHTYFIMTTDGVLRYDGYSDTSVSSNILEDVDVLGRKYIEDIIDGVTTSLDNNTNVSAFLIDDVLGTTVQFMYSGHLIEGTNLILYTRASLVDFTENELIEYLDYISKYYANKERHAFILTKDGTMLYHKDSEKIGVNVSDMTDLVWKKTGTEVIEFMENETEGFFNVTFYANTIDGELSERVLYLQYIPEWDIIIGYGENTNLYDHLVDDFQEDSIKQVLTLLLPIYIIITGFVFFLTRLIIKNNNLSMKLFNEEEELYRIFSDITEDLIIITDKKGDIIFTNKLGSKVIFDTDEAKKVNLDELMVDEEGFKVLLGIKENYYIKYTISQINFNGQEADLYIVSDVTEKVRTERKLEAMTLADDLTGLGNRRLLVKDYNNHILPQIKEGHKAFLAMLDLDNFKPANDVYGHSYGDEVLKQIAVIFREEANENVRIYRVGGDEFAILASEFTQNEFLGLLRKLKNKVVNFNYEKEVNISFSAGVIEININDKKRRLSDYYEKADELMYKAKDEGKSKILIK